MYDVTAIVPRGQGIGFTLAGVEVREAADIADAHKVLALEIDNERNGIILVYDKFIRDLPPKLQKQIDKSAIPLVVSIPIITEWEYTHDRDEIIRNIIRRAVGYRIKISEGLQ